MGSTCLGGAGVQIWRASPFLRDLGVLGGCWKTVSRGGGACDSLRESRHLAMTWPVPTRPLHPVPKPGAMSACMVHCTH